MYAFISLMRPMTFLRNVASFATSSLSVIIIPPSIPVVAFAEAINGTTLRGDEHLLLTIKNEAAVLAALRRLIGDPVQARQLGDRGRKLVVEEYDWNSSGRKLEHALVHLVRNRSCVRTSLSWLLPANQGQLNDRPDCRAICNSKVNLSEMTHRWDPIGSRFILELPNLVALEYREEPLP